MNHITIKTKGMHCTSCERVIEKAAMAIEGVKEVKADYAKEETKIEFDESITSLDKILDTIKKEGYTTKLIQPITKQKEYITLPKSSSKYFLIAGSILFLLGLIWIIKYSFSFSLPEITPEMGLALIFMVGLLTSFHCIGMCGGFV
ncbi:MAG: cation transporter, partial [Nanoarchaeota archaeon]